MSDRLLDAVAEALPHLAEPQYDAQRQAATFEHIARRVRRERKRPRRNAAIALAAAAIFGALFGLTAMALLSSRAPMASTPGPRVELASESRLSDGSRVSATSPDARLVLLEAAERRIRIVVERGGARFEVSHRPERRFRVEVGSVSVEALGTVYTVTRLGENAARVEVADGRVRVEWPGGARELVAGQSADFPPEVALSAPRSSSPTAPSARAPEGPDNPGAPVASASASWRVYAQTDVHKAYEALSRVGADTVSTPDDLLLAADVARRTGHPEAALGYLAQIVSHHPGDSRAAVAAFTAGRVCQQLGRSTEAARYFTRAWQMSPGGPLGQNALANAAETWSRSGNASEAKRLAGTYVELFPGGAELERMRVLAGAGD